MISLYKYVILSFIFFYGITTIVFAENSNVGIIEGLWFSEAPFFDGENITIYTAVQNNSGSEVNGIVEFFEGDILLGVKKFTTKNTGIVEVSINTIATAGKHIFSVQITEIQEASTEGSVLIDSSSIFYEKEVLVKTDFDGDNIPDDIDPDDDNDGYSDIEEEKQGSNSLDNQDIPIEIEGLVETSNIINTIGNIFFTNDTQKDPDYEKELQERTPDVILSVVSNKPVLLSASRGVSSLQLATEKALDRAIEKKQKINDQQKPFVGMDIDQDEDVKVFIDNKKGTSSAVIGMLNIIQKIVSFWWLFPILIFIAIWIVLKILFKIFSRKR